MASCSYCAETILFGGVKSGDQRFCNQTCQTKGQLSAAATRIPEPAARDLASKIHNGPCPRCQGPGPVDVHTAYWVWSALAFTRWGSLQKVSCRPCAVKFQLGRLATSTLFGWWGFPWGIIFTPVQVGRTAIAILSPPTSTEPSPKLLQLARVQLASAQQASPATINTL